MAKAMLLGPVEMAEVEARVANMGKGLYQLLEDYPSLQPPDWTYIEAVMFLHQRIYDEAVKLKKAALFPEGACSVQPPSGEQKNKGAA